MSHFVGLVIVPKNDVSLNPDYPNSGDEVEDDFGTMKSMPQYVSAFKSPLAEEILAPYCEQDEEYCIEYGEKNDQINQLLNLYLNDKDVNDYFNEIRLRYENSIKESTSFDEEEQAKRLDTKYMDEKYKDFEKLRDLMNDKKFKLSYLKHQELLKQEFGYSDKHLIEDNEYLDIFMTNPNAQWDWYVEGGRWREYGEQGIFNDLTEVTETRTVAYWETLGFHKTTDEEREQMSKGNFKDIKIAKDYKRDDEGLFLRDKDNKAIPLSYYTEEELKEEQEIMNTPFFAIIDENGWHTNNQMGWFGISDRDSMSSEERKQERENEINEWNDILQEYIDSETEYVGLTYDFHI